MTEIGVDCAVHWDWKDQPPWNAINRAISSLTERGFPVVLYDIEDTGGDCYGLLISGHADYTQDAADKAWHILDQAEE